MEFVTALRGTFDEQKPSLFEVLSEQQLNALLPPTLRYLLTIATHRHPRYLLRILNSFDEIYAGVMLLVERHYLRTRGGSFTENFYGLKREKSLHAEVPRASMSSPDIVRETLKLTTRDVWKNLLVIVGIPYLKRKLDESYEVNAPRALLGAAYTRMPDNPTLRDRFLYYYRWFLRNIYPSVNAGYYFAMLAFNVAYLFDGSKYHSPLLWLIGTRIRRMSGADYKAIEALTQTPETGHRPGWRSLLNPREMGPRVLSSLSILLPTSIFALKFLEWWYQSDFAKQLSRKATESVDLPPPVISADGKGGSGKKRQEVKEEESNEGDSIPSAEDAPIATPSLLPVYTIPFPSDSALCPICIDEIVTPTACQTGVVYCYTCIHKWIEGQHQKQEDFMESREGKWERDSLISGFDWFNGRDLSNGFVQYQDLEGAEQYGLYSVDPFSNTVRLRPDSARKFGLDEGRPSVRLESKESYQYGLFIADFQHMPISQCGTWPAFWAYGANWPNNGEVDILEGANLAYTNIMSAHTADGCMLDPADSNLFSGNPQSLDCAVGTDNVGCGFTPPASDTSSYGDGFNAVGGGVYAMEWDSEYISIWHFPRGAIPADIEAKRPDPKKWGLPQSLFGGSKCNVDEYFNDMRIVLNINFCGDYGEGTWGSSETCRALAPTCREYVANNPLDFQDAYFDVSYIDVYTRLGGDVPPVVPSSTSEAPAEISIPSAGTPDPNTPISGNTRFPNNTAIVTRPRPKEGESTTAEPTTTTTLTGISSVEVTIPGSGTNSATVSSLPVATGGSSVNPAKIDDYAYLGCFGSQTGFQTFNEKAESDDMTIEKCIETCNGLTYIGLFEGTCYCASKLDADTRALRNETSCNRPCPGNDDQFCGGMVSQRSKRSIPLRRDAPNNILLTVYADTSDAGQPDVPPGMGPGVDGTVAAGGSSSPTGGSGQGNSPADGVDGSTGSESQAGDSAQETTNGQAGSGDDLPAATNNRVVVDTPTVTDVIAGTDADAVVFSTLSGGEVLEATPAIPDTVVTSTITFFTVLPTNPRSLVPQESIVTMSYSLCDYCDTPTLMQPAMATKVVECDGCGTNGENTVTLTVPVHVTVTVTGAGTNATRATGNAAAEVVPDQTREIPPIVPTGMGSKANAGPEVTTIVITYLTTQLVTYGTETNSVSTETRTLRRTVVLTVSDIETMSILPVPSPGRPNTLISHATPTPGASGAPAVVSSASSRVDDFFVYFAIVAMAILALSL
ncbi:mixed-linked glucanase precursor MLG1 [Fusarium acutatum]|uniref:Peroxisome assembly protein 12 n=1 Tax=Fusarium acutatum TaxID=78861 RepID=A0A8H4K5J9_9HYPO|nr:mixed-linked glucanase precursor MLG1 [Fusarium acutatum]